LGIPAAHFIYKRAEKIGSFLIKNVSPIRSIKNTTTPILYIHGLKDIKVNVSYCEEMFTNSNPASEKYILENADHNNLHEIGGDLYFPRIAEFIKKCI
jgi:uncharacterized protein